MMSLSSCIYMHHGAPQFRREWSKLKDYVVDTVMYTIQNEEGGKDKAYEILCNVYTEEEFATKYDDLHIMLKDIGEFSLSVESFTSTEEDGVTVEEGTFGLYTENGNFIVHASRSSDTDGLTSFSITPDTENVLPERD